MTTTETIDEPRVDDFKPGAGGPRRSGGSRGDGLLAKGSQGRRVATIAGAVVLTLLITQFVFPGAEGAAGRGTPGAILFTGFTLGLVKSLTAAGLILVYRTNRIINFAQTAIGVAGATLVFDVVQLTPVPFFLILPLGLLFSVGLGVLFELVIVRRFFYASRLVLTVATIAAAQIVAYFAPQIVRSMPFIPYDSASIQQAIGTSSVRRVLPFAGFEFGIGDLNLRFGFPELFAIELAVVLLLTIAAFFRFTRAGVAVRAMAENSERASMLGISIGGLSMIVWALAGLLGGASAIATGAVLTPGAAQSFAPTILIPALAAAVLAQFRSLPVAVLASVLIGMVSQAVQWSFSADVPLVNVALFVIIGIALFVQRSRAGRSEDGGGVTWQAVEEPRPIPRELATVGTVRLARWGLIALGALIVIGYPFVVSTGPIVLGGNVALVSIVILSLVVLTGWSGQVSLGQFGFAAVGAVLGGALTSRVGIPFWFAIFLAAALTGAIAVLIGLPALRIRGLFLAVTTLAFSLAVASVLFNERYFGWLLPDDVDRPTLFLLDFEDERSMYYLCVAALALCIVLVTNLRRSRLGRVLIALRENEANVQSFGINLVRTKLTAFAISGALAGFAGAVMAHQLRGLNAETFGAARSLDVFLYAVFGGASSVWGALLGSLWYNVTNYFTITNPILRTLFQNSGTFFVVLLMFVAPGGLVSLLNRVRDAGLRIVAQRRQLIVPSLFADYDPEALEKRLIPLGPPSNLDGLAALPEDDRYTMASELYAGSGERIIEKLEGPRATREAAAIGAASESLQQLEAAELAGQVATAVPEIGRGADEE